MCCKKFKLFATAVLLALPAAAMATPLAVVNVNAPAVNCVFDTSCTILVSDSIGEIPLPGISGTARLQSRTFVGSSGAPAAGLQGYMYRVDLTNAVGTACVQGLKISFGPVVSLQYDGMGSLDQVFVVTSGGLGSVGISSADQFGNEIYFTFAAPVCAGASLGTGATSFFFGLASNHAPTAITGLAVDSMGFGYLVAARAPSP